MNLVGPRDSNNDTGRMGGNSGEQDDRSTDKLDRRVMADETKEANDATPTYGRRGDPRMHRALAAKQSNPKMTLLDALLTGGFVFPDLGDPGMSDRTIRDQDNVLLYQRKNQLNRRLRLARSTAGHDRGKHPATQKLGDDADAAGDGSKKALAPTGMVGTGKDVAMGQHQPFMALPLEMQQNLQQTLLSMSASGMHPANLAGNPGLQTTPSASTQDKGGNGGAAAPSAAAAGGAYPGPAAQNYLQRGNEGDLMSMAYFFAQQQQLQQQQLQQQHMNMQQQQQHMSMQQQHMQGMGMNKFNNAALLAASLVAGQGGAAQAMGGGGAAQNSSEGGRESAAQAGTTAGSQALGAGGSAAAAATNPSSAGGESNKQTAGGAQGDHAWTPWQGSKV